MKYNSMMGSQFAGYPQIAEFPDVGRHRTVKVFYIGEPDVVGFADGTDAWVADPATAVKSPDLVEAMKAHLEGREFTPARPVTKRVRLEEPAPASRRRVHVD